MKYYIAEIQNDEGNYAYIIHQADNRQSAESVYHQVLAAAAISNLTSHSAIMYTAEGAPVMYQCYRHEQITPEEEI